MKRRKKKWKQKKSKWLDDWDKETNNLRNYVAKHNKHKGGSHKSKKDYDRKILVQKLKKYIAGLV